MEERGRGTEIRKKRRRVPRRKEVDRSNMKEERRENKIEKIEKK